MATLLQSAVNHSTGNVASLTTTFSQGCTSGSTILVFVGTELGSKTFTASDITNGAYNVDVGSNGAGSSIDILSFPGNTATSALQVTATLSSGTGQILMLIQEWSGILTPTPFDTSSTASGSGTSLSVGPTATLAQSNELAVAMAFVNGNEGTLANTSAGWTDDSLCPIATSGGSLTASYISTSSTAGQSIGYSWAVSHGSRAAIATYKKAAYVFPTQTISSTEGTLGESVGYPSSLFAGVLFITEVHRPMPPSIDVNLGAQTVAVNEGAILFAVNLGSTSATFTEGTITASLSNNQTYQLSAINAQFVFGIPTDGVSYLLDQNTILILGQTAAFSEGIIALERDATLTAFTIPSTEGTVTYGPSYTFTAQTIASHEGNITATAGANQNVVMASQAIGASLGVLAFESDHAITAQTITSAEGTITFSNVADQFLMPAFTIGATEGVITVTGPPIGTGPPLFIPPQLGKPVTTRTFSWSDMAQRAWGSEFRAPDHRIYQFSGGNYKDSTDMGTTGIYSPNLGTPDNPPPHP